MGGVSIDYPDTQELVQSEVLVLKPPSIRLTVSRANKDTSSLFLILWCCEVAVVVWYYGGVVWCVVVL